MKVINNKRQGFRWTKQGQRVMVAAIGAVGLANFNHVNASTLFFDSNGATSGLGTAAGTWNSTNLNWATSATPGTAAPIAWVPGSVASFNAGFGAISVGAVESISGINFVTGGQTITVAGAGPWALAFGSNSFTLANNVNNTKQVLSDPITGSGDMTITSSVTTTQPIDLAGVLTGFTGNIIVNDPTGTITAVNATQLQLDSPLGDTTKTIKLDQFCLLADNNQITGAGTPGDPLTGQNTGANNATPCIYTIANPIILNYKGVANNTQNVIGTSNGPTVGGVTFSKIANYSGVISSPAGVTTNLKIDGPRGTTELSGQNTYNGSTTIHAGNGNGMTVLGADNTLPSTTDLIIGIGNADIIGPIDLDGHNQTIRSINTSSTNTTNTGVGNIYNLGVVNTVPGHTYSTNPSNNPATLTLTPLNASSTTYLGDIGDTNTATNPFNDNVPYKDGTVTANTNINLVLNGPSGGVGTNTLKLAPIANLTSGNEYSGTTTINNNAVLMLGRVNTGSPGNGYTVTGNGAVTVNSGGVLTSSATGTTSYAGGFGGNIEIKSGGILNPGGTGATGILSTNSMTVDAGANLNFEFGANATLFDSVNLNGGLTLDTTGNSTLNIAVATSGIIPGPAVTPGTYTLINANGGISSDGVHGLVLGTPPSGTHDTFTLQTNGNLVQVVVNANALRWDPSGNGAASPPVQEAGGTWADGTSKFVDLSTTTSTEATWSNTTTKDVVIGNDAGQTGGQITLGTNINVNGAITFGPIFPGFNYSITDGGSGNTLTIGGGINVSNAAAGTFTPSAEIDAPIILSADQTWNVDPGQFFDVKGLLTGNSTTLTKVGTGNVFFEHSGGSLGTLNANGGIVLLGAADALGNATLNVNGGGVQWGTNLTVTNPINIGANGALLGATTGFTVTIPNNFSTTNALTTIGTGTTVLSGNLALSSATFTSAQGSSGITLLTGTNNIGTLSSTGGTVVLAGNDTVALLAQKGGVSVLANTTDTIGSIAITGGITVFATDPPQVGTFTVSGGTLQIGAGTTSGSLGSFSFTTTTVGTAGFQGALVFDRSDTFTFSNLIFGGGGSLSVQQSGPGTTILTNTNSYTGGTQVNNGTLMLGVNAALGAGGTLNINGANNMAVFDLNGFNQTVLGLRDGATVNAGNELITNSSATVSTLTIGNTGAAVYSGAFSGNLNILHTGTANETLAGNNTITGGVFLSAGTLQIGGGTTSGTLGTAPVMANAAATIAFSRSDTVTINNSLSGAGLSVQQSGSGTTIIANSNSFTGGTGITSGTLQLGVSSALGAAGTMSIGASTNSVVSTFDLNGFNQRVLSLVDGGTTNFGNESVTNSQGTASTLSFASGSGTFNGIISGNINILHDGSGFQGLEGNNTFTGSVTVSAGTISSGTATWNAANTPGPFGEQPDGIGTVALGGATGTTGVLDYEGTQSFTLPRPISMTGGGVGGIRIINATGQLTVPAGSISGNGGFEKLGNGTIIMQGAQTYRGPVMDVNGNLNIDTVADIGQPSGFGTGDATANSAAIQLGDGSGNVGTISFNSPTPQETNRPFTEVQNGTGGHVIMAGDLSAPGAVATSNLTLTGGIDLTNSVSTTGGTVIFGGAGVIIVSTNPIAGPLGNVVLGINNSSSPTTNGTGTLILSGNNTYGGGTTLRNGTLQITGDTNLGAAGTSVTFAGVGTEAGTLLLVGSSTLNRPLVFNQASTATATINFATTNVTVGPISGSGTFFKTDSGITSTPSVRINGLNIGAGTVGISGPRALSSTSVINTLTIAGSPGTWNATLDLGSNDLVVDYTGASPIGTVVDQIKSGLHGGTWTGPGITSSAAAAAVASAHPTVLGYAEASAVLGATGGIFDGLPVDSTAVLVRYTLPGDANLDGTVNALDFNALATNFGTNNGSQIWSNADFNYDGIVNTLDFTALSNNFGGTIPSSAPALGSLVPEPSTIALMAIALPLIGRRRKR